MTTPNQQKPQYGTQWDAFAYEVGGGEYNFGQLVTEELAVQLIHGPRATPDNVWTLIEDKLLQLPLETLRMFQPFIEGSSMETDFPDIPLSVDTIMRWLPTNPTVVSLEQAQKWLEDTFKPLSDKVQEVIDAIIRGFHAWFDQIGFDTGDVQQFSNTVGSALGTLGTLGLRLQRLENANNAKILEDFSTYPQNVSSLGSAWSQSYVGSGGGTLGAVNKFAVVSLALDTSNRLMYARHNTGVGSDLQRVAATISTPASLFGDSANLLIARANAAMSDFVYTKLTAGRIEVGFVRNGAVTVLGTKERQFVNGSVYTLDCSEPSRFRVFENKAEVFSVIDSGAGSAIGAGNQFVGFGALCPNGVARPGVLGSFAAYVL